MASRQKWKRTPMPADPLTLHRVTRHPEGGWQVVEERAVIEENAWRDGPEERWVPGYAILDPKGGRPYRFPADQLEQRGYFLSREEALGAFRVEKEAEVA